MLKDITISILTGIAISQHFNPPDAPARLAIILIVAVTVFMVLLELEDLWDKRRQITQRVRAVTNAIRRIIHAISHQIHSHIRWYLIRLHTWPMETAQRRRRRQMMRDYIQRLHETRIPQGSSAQERQESEV